jgi:hypothetical protein
MSVMPVSTTNSLLKAGRAQRLLTTDDVIDFDSWWGIGPQSPDRRLEAAMPGHVLASEVVVVTVQKSCGIQDLWQQLPMSQLCGDFGKYVLWQMKLGKLCLLSLHQVVDEPIFEQVLHAGGEDFMESSLKLIVTPINLQVSVPAKGPKSADTIKSFFGSGNVSFHREGNSQFDVAMLSIDLYSVWSLKMLLPAVAFKSGRMVDFHLVSYRDNAVLASYRAAMTPSVIQKIHQMGLD